MIKRADGPNGHGEATINRANEAKGKSTVTVNQTSKENYKINKHKVVLSMRDFRDHLDQLQQIL